MRNIYFPWNLVSLKYCKFNVSFHTPWKHQKTFHHQISNCFIFPESSRCISLRDFCRSYIVLKDKEVFSKNLVKSLREYCHTSLINYKWWITLCLSLKLLFVSLKVFIHLLICFMQPTKSWLSFWNIDLKFKIFVCILEV